MKGCHKILSLVVVKKIERAFFLLSIHPIFHPLLNKYLLNNCYIPDSQLYSRDTKMNEIFLPFVTLTEYLRYYYHHYDETVEREHTGYYGSTE